MCDPFIVPIVYSARQPQTHISIYIKLNQLAIMEWSKKTYNEKYDTWMPWVQDNFLYYFTKDNKVSYATKGTRSSLFPRQHRTDTTP